MRTTPATHQLRNLVTEQIRASILDGKYKPGEWLRQEHIAQELNVSQMPVREALKQLVAVGLVEHVPYRGARVVEFSIHDVEDLYITRAFLEGRAAGIAATQITPEELAELKHLHAEIEAHEAPEHLLTYRELNRQFHQLIFTSSHRPYLIRTLTQLWEAFPTMLIGNFVLTASAPLGQREQVDVQEHAAIIAALENKDARAAEQAMSEHIQSVLRDFTGVLRLR